MVKKLPEFNGYTVDIKLKQFRKTDPKNNISFIDFKSEKGDNILSKYINYLYKEIKTMKNIINKIKNSL